MLKRRLTTLTLAKALTNGAMALAQETPQPPARAPQAPKAKAQSPIPTTRPAPTPRVYVPPHVDEDSETQASPVTMKVARNAHIAVTSKMVNIHITGIDGDTLEATATSDEGSHPVKAQTSGDEAN